MRVLKYTLHESGATDLGFPMGAKFLHVAEQCGALQLWALCLDTDARLDKRRINVAFTGHHYVAEGAIHIGTVLSEGGNIVRHVFEEPIV